MRNEYYDKAVKIAERLGEAINPGLKVTTLRVLDMCEDGRMEDYRDGFTHGLYMANVISQEEKDIIRMACMISELKEVNNNDGKDNILYQFA